MNVKGKKAIVFGGGRVASRRTAKLLDAGAKVKVVAKTFSESIRKMSSKNLQMVEEDLNNINISNLIKEGDLIFISTNDRNLNDKIEKEARRQRKLVNRADGVSDFVIPASLKVGDVLISISTEGKSPAVAKALKKRIKKTITQEDIMLVELQEFARSILKRKFKDQQLRESILREIISMPEILEYLKIGDTAKAKRLVLDHLEEA